ncbi:MAG TPA: hypothetical protein PK156_27150 [Polyangium sp.]|nr:hypothetical protein [Polyangium sp.]
MPQPSTSPASWTPEGFERYRERYPNTPEFAHPDPAPTERFISIWREFQGSDGQWPIQRRTQMTEALRNTTFVLIRGFLGNWMPGNFISTCRTLRTMGLDAFIAKNSAGATTEDNARSITRQIQQRVPATNRLVFLGHSKGGLESLQIAADPILRPRVRAIVMAQTPRGASAVMESLLLRRHQASLAGFRRVWAERLQRFGLRMIRVEKGGREITTEGLKAVIERLDAIAHPFALLQTASWSTQPTAWLDSFHERLGEIRPGCAHDGQFYLEDLIWPGVPHVLLPHVDHAQPAMGGFGFNPAQYWLSAITLLVEEQLHG